jgi:hypothetical protein
MMNIQKHTIFNKVHYYALEPHDGSHYEFMMMRLKERAGNTELTHTSLDDPNSRILESSRTLSDKPSIMGVGDGSDYIQITIIMETGQASVPILEAHLYAIDRACFRSHGTDDLIEVAQAVGSVYGYFQGHSGNQIYIVTLCAVLLAASSLFYEPDDMLRAAEAGRMGQYVAALL